MIENYDADDTFLARWIAGTLTKEERIGFEKTDTYKQLSIINRESQLLKGPDINTDTALEKVKQKINTKRNKTKVFRLWYSVAAAAAVLIGLGVFLNSSKTYTTGIGETMSVTLADGSIIDLNANSKLSHKRFFWENNREVDFTGEAYFVVKKGDDFVVSTSKGKVEVLGTEFNIKDRSYFELKCYEGKVSFINNNFSSEPSILTKGMKVLIEENKVKKIDFNEETPDWKQGISKFKNQPLMDVLEELQQIYPITFQLNNIDTSRIFSGSFRHDNLKNALQTTLSPMGITYQKGSKNNLIILSE
ncbi:FecR family protein [Flavivirga algicola]|uniref:Iron dicitrate transport regulator FecR n=1 Tax=Flavivirga algicola TaxID=2729136 RepID=A0ABX1S0Z7_9FLAO|nr:FecR domain-containing protein [Flavivirga algicola]NMH88404.1 iron dicitrate transport regulator FecR [Flavivirga algicola]